MPLAAVQGYGRRLPRRPSELPHARSARTVHTAAKQEKRERRGEGCIHSTPRAKEEPGEKPDHCQRGLLAVVLVLVVLDDREEAENASEAFRGIDESEERA